LIPRQDKLEHTNTIKTMTDDELESAIAILNEMMAAQAVGSAHLIEMKAETAALPAPGGQSPREAIVQAQAEPADDRGRYCDRAAGAQAEEARAVACYHL